MNLSEVKSLDKATTNQLLLMILSTQIQIARRLELLEQKLTGKEEGLEDEEGEEKTEGVQNLTKDIVDKLDSFLDRLNDSIQYKNN